jgi:hypothetical protein
VERVVARSGNYSYYHHRRHPHPTVSGPVCRRIGVPVGASFAILEKRWNKAHINWALFTDHLELDNLKLKLIRLQEFIESQDEVNAKVEAGEAMVMIRHIPERERLTWRNVF